MGKKFGDPHGFYACVGKGQTCGKKARPGKVTCEECGDRVQIPLPQRVLIRAHFMATSATGKVFVEDLVKAGVQRIDRSTVREEELKLRRMFSAGIKVFGENDLGPLVAAGTAAEDLGRFYSFTNIHVVRYDESFAKVNPKRVGEQVVVYVYEYSAESKAISMPPSAAEILAQSFLGSRVYVNLVDRDGTRIHCVELKGFQFDYKPRFRLRFINGIWAFDYIPKVKPAESTLVGDGG